MSDGGRDDRQPGGRAAAVHAVLTAAASERAQVVVVVGARGAGKSSVLDVARRVAVDDGRMVLATGASIDGQPTPFGAVVELVSGVHELPPALSQLCRGTGGRPQVNAVRLELLRLLQDLAARRPVVVVVDDLDLLDRQSAEVLTFALNRLDREPLAAFVSCRRRPGWSRATSWAVDPLSEDQLVGVLGGRGLAAEPARACARAARGLPGMAIALAEELTSEQRSGTAVLPTMLRPPQSLLEQPFRALEAFPVPLQRVLVVVAADDDGNLVAIRRALTHLGEDPTLLEAAEARGVLELDGPWVRFVDPWWRPAAYHLVAPASRRAAHRALALAYDQPHHGVARAWQLAAAETGPSDDVAEALGLVALSGVGRASRSAAIILDRAIDFAATEEMRDHLLLRALELALDDLDLDRARALAGRIVPHTDDLAVAVVEAFDLCGLPVADTVPAGVDGSWAARRRARLAVDDAARGGRQVDPPSERSTTGHTARALLAQAQWLRHSGRLSDARRAVLHAESLLTPSCRELAAVAHVLQADLDQLAGRPDECTRHLDAVGRTAGVWTRTMADLVALRRDASVDGESPSPWASRVAVDAAADPLATVRARLARSSRLRDASGLVEVASQAEALGLPVEACEATLAALEATVAAGGRIDAHTHRDLVDRLWAMGVHAWDRRVRALEDAIDATAARDLSCLSQAELRVAEAVGSGLTNREAANRLYLSVKTVDFHLQQIYRKLDLRSRTELAVVMSTQRSELRRVGAS